MSGKAFVLIETAVGETKGVLSKLTELEGVKSADAVTGPYDIITVIELESLNDIGEFIDTRIHLVTGISRTVTCLAI